MTDLDLEQLRVRIAAKWLELTGEAMLPGMLEWAYREVLVLVVSWFKIDLEKAIAETFERYLAEVQKLPYGGNSRAAIIALAKNYTDVADVNVNVPSANLINVFLLAKTGTPTTGQIAGLQTYLNSDRVRNICDTFQVFAASEVIWDSQINITVSGDLTAIRTSAQTAIANYALSKQKLGATIQTDDIIATIKAVSGVVKVVVVSPAVDVLTTAGQFPKLGTNTVNSTAAR